MFGISATQWMLAGGIVSLGALFEAWRQGGLTAIWGYFTKRSPAATSTPTDQQAFDAAMLLARYKATSKSDQGPGYKAVMAALEAALEAK